MKTEKMPISDFIKNMSLFVDGCILYLKKTPICFDDEVLVSFDKYSCDPIGDYQGILPCKDVQQILINLQSQNPNPTINDYIEAINYYIENDAFIDVENRENKPQGGFKIWG